MSISPNVVSAAMRALDRGQPTDLEVVVGRARASGAVIDELICEVLVPVQADVGRRWADDQWSVAEEHQATRVVAGLVALLSGDVAGGDGPHVIVCCVDTETHALPAQMIALLLMARELRVTLLDASTTPRQLGHFVERLRPSAVALSCTQASRLPGARASVRAAHAAGVPALLGGRGTGTDGRRARAIGADGWASGADDASAVLRGWLKAPPVLLDPDPDSEAVELHNDPDLVRVVMGGTVNAHLRGDASAIQWARRQLEELVAHLAVAVEVRDPVLMVEHVAWLERVLNARGHSAGAVGAALADLSAALRPGGGAAQQVLRAARAAVAGGERFDRAP